MILAYPSLDIPTAVLPSHEATLWHMSSCTPRENTTTFDAHRGAVLCYRAAAGFAVRAGPSLSSPPRRRRRLSGSARGLDIDTPPERPRGAARPCCRRRHRDVATSPAPVEGSTSARPRRVCAGRCVFVTTVAVPAVHPRARRARGLASVGRGHPRAARVCSPPLCALLWSERAFAPPCFISTS